MAMRSNWNRLIEEGQSRVRRADNGSAARSQTSVRLADSGPDYREIVPEPSLRPSVASFWERASRYPDAHSLVVPDGCMDIVWIGASEVLVAGPATRAIAVSSTPGTSVVGARFRPGIAPLFLRFPASDFLDRFVPLDQIWPRESRELTEKGDGRAGAAEKLDLLQRLLVSKVSEASLDDDLVHAGVSILNGAPPIGVHELAVSLSVSQRHLLRRFRAAVGYGPKTLQRILRFQRALDLLRSPTRPATLTEIALRSGYSDHAHMTREFVELAGVPPARLAGMRLLT